MQPSFEALGSGGVAIVAGLLLFAAAHGLGGALLPKGQPAGCLNRFGLRIAVGLNLLAWLGMTGGLLGGLGNGRTVLLLVAAASLSAVALWRDRPFRINFSTNRTPLWFAAPAAVVAGITLGPALCYPTGWDELVYHHELPRRWLAAGWPAFYPDVPYSGFPSLGEVLFWLAGPIECVILPRLVVWMSWMVALLLVYTLLRRRLAAGAALLLTAAFGLSGAVLMVSANCYVESLLLLNSAAMLAALESRELRRLPAWRYAAVVGLLAGGAAAIKLTGLAIAIVPLAYFAALARQPPQRRPKKSPSQRKDALRRLAICALAAAALALPFYLRPWLLTGNPFYPYYASWFASDPATIEMSRYHHALGAAFGLRDPIGLLAAPLLLAYDFDLYDGAFGWQFPAVLLLAGFALREIRRRPRQRLLALPAAMAVWLYVFWFLTAQQARFLIPGTLALLLVAAAGLRTVRGGQRKVALGLLLVLTLVSLPWRNTGYYVGSWLAATGAICSRDYVDESTDKVYLPLAAALAEHTPPAARVMLLFEHRLFYLPRQATIGTPFFQEAGFTPPEQFEHPESFLRQLHAAQITHLVVTNAPAGPDQVPGWLDRMERFLPCIGECERAGHLTVVWRSERYVLLAVQQPQELSTYRTVPSRMSAENLASSLN